MSRRTATPARPPGGLRWEPAREAARSPRRPCRALAAPPRSRRPRSLRGGGDEPGGELRARLLPVRRGEGVAGRGRGRGGRPVVDGRERLLQVEGRDRGALGG